MLLAHRKGLLVALLMEDLARAFDLDRTSVHPLLQVIVPELIELLAADPAVRLRLVRDDVHDRRLRSFASRAFGDAEERHGLLLRRFDSFSPFL